MAYTLSATLNESASQPARPAPAIRSISMTICGFPEYSASTVGGNRSHHSGRRSMRRIATALRAVMMSHRTAN